MPLTRRRLLGVAAGAALGLAGCSSSDEPGLVDAPESATCVARASLDRVITLGDQDLVYEVNGRASPFFVETGFWGQLERWYAGFVDTAGVGPVDAVRTYGTWIDGRGSCDSWHHAGRAFDLARLRSDGEDVVSCRYDRWSTARDAPAQLRRYWALAASLHHDFAYVLTYLYDDAHANHIHVDNGRSGDGLSTLSTRSRVQVQAVQAICTHVWDTPVATSGRWDAATRDASRTVLDRLEVRDDLDESVDSWRAFLRASTARFAAD